MHCAASREHAEVDVVVALDEVSAEGVCGDVRCEAGAEDVHASVKVAYVQCRYAVKVKEKGRVACCTRNSIKSSKSCLLGPKSN